MAEQETRQEEQDSWDEKEYERVKNSQPDNTE